MLTLSATIAIIGLLLSAYGIYLERKIATNPDYKPACDINDRMSCTKPITSPYGKVFGMSNAKIGLAFYTAVIMAALAHQPDLVRMLATGSIAGSAVLAYILYVKIRTVCLLCSAIYATNIVLFLTSWYGA